MTLVDPLLGQVWSAVTQNLAVGGVTVTYFAKNAAGGSDAECGVLMKCALQCWCTGMCRECAGNVLFSAWRSILQLWIFSSCRAPELWWAMRLLYFLSFNYLARQVEWFKTRVQRKYSEDWRLDMLLKEALGGRNWAETDSSKSGMKEQE